VSKTLRTPSHLRNHALWLAVGVACIAFVGCTADETEAVAALCPAAPDSTGCDDGDECTIDSAAGPTYCGHRSDPACGCLPDCNAAAGDVLPGQVLRLGDGGLPGLEGPTDVALAPNSRDVYLAASWSESITRLVTTDGHLEWRSTHALPGVRQVAVSPLGDRIVAAGISGVFEGLREQDGSVSGFVSVAGPATGILHLGEHVVLAGNGQLRLYRVGASSAAAWSEVGSPVPATGVREMLSTAAMDVVYAAAFGDDSDDGQVLALNVSDAGLEVIMSLSGHPGLNRPDALALSTDQQTLFVAGFCDHDLAVVARADDGSLTWQASVFGDEPIADCLSADFGEDEDGPDVLRVHRPTSLSMWGNTLVAAGGSVGSPELLLLDWNGQELVPGGFIESSLDPVAMGTLDYVTDRENQPLPDDPELVRGVVTTIAGPDALIVTALTTGAVAMAPNEMNTYSSTVRVGQYGVDGVGGVHEIDISPDGRHLYAAPRSQNAVGIFAIEAGDTLSPRGALTLPVLGEIPGVIGTLRVVPDGSQVLAVDTFNPLLYALDRDTECGGLQVAQIVTIPSCREPFPLTVAIRLGPLGRDVYLSDFQRDGTSCLIQMRRDPESGRLADGATFYDDDFLAGVESFELTADGVDLYTGSYLASSVGHYRRDPGDGTLTVGSPVTDPMLFGAEFLILSEDERTVYVANPVGSRMLVYGRAADTGVLTFQQSVETDPAGPFLDGAAGLAVTATTLYVAAHHADTINVFGIGADGRLAFQSAYQDQPGLDWVHSLRLSPGGTRLFAGALKDSAVSSLRLALAGGDGCGGTCP
jgi:6-phosphogluconolactonase (cycloisomerase 2 family)